MSTTQNNKASQLQLNHNDLTKKVNDVIGNGTTKQKLEGFIQTDFYTTCPNCQKSYITDEGHLCSIWSGEINRQP